MAEPFLSPGWPRLVYEENSGAVGEGLRQLVVLTLALIMMRWDIWQSPSFH
jgi:hypothetical protein